VAAGLGISIQAAVDERHFHPAADVAPLCAVDDLTDFAHSLEAIHAMNVGSVAKRFQGARLYVDDDVTVVKDDDREQVVQRVVYEHGWRAYCVRPGEPIHLLPQGRFCQAAKVLRWIQVSQTELYGLRVIDSGGLGFPLGIETVRMPATNKRGRHGAGGLASQPR
jgi:hypothetical protein